MSNFKVKRTVTCSEFGHCPNQGETCKEGAVFEAHSPTDPELLVLQALFGKPGDVLEEDLPDGGTRIHITRELTPLPMEVETVGIRDLLKTARIDKSLN